MYVDRSSHRTRCCVKIFGLRISSTWVHQRRARGSRATEVAATTAQSPPSRTPARRSVLMSERRCGPDGFPGLEIRGYDGTKPAFADSHAEIRALRRKLGR